MVSHFVLSYMFTSKYFDILGFFFRVPNTADFHSGIISHKLLQLTDTFLYFFRKIENVYHNPFNIFTFKTIYLLDCFFLKHLRRTKVEDTKCIYKTHKSLKMIIPFLNTDTIKD